MSAVERVIGDHWSGDFIRRQFVSHGLSYDVSARTKPQIYLDVLPLINAGRILLLDDDRIIQQALGLERHVPRGTARVG
jgi:hypothetical protein